MDQPPFLGCLEASTSHSCSSKIGQLTPQVQSVPSRTFAKADIMGDALASKTSDLQTEKAIVLPLKEENRPRHWCRVCSKGIPPNEVFPVNLVSGRRLEIWKCRTQNHLMCLPSLTWIYDDLCPSCVKKRHRACDQPSHAEMRSNPVSTQARDAPCEGIYHLGARAFFFLCLSPDSS